MEITVEMFLLLLGFAFVCEFIDSSLGMGYGTILTPSLLILGFNPLLVVPAVLLSQAIGGLSASVFHQQFENVDFRGNSSDLKVVFYISGLGIIATIIAAIFSINLPKFYLKSYIGILVLAMGILILINKTFTFSWRKMIAVGLLSAFNKGISGGGFGPVVTGGQILAGRDHKSSIGVTTLAEAPICICGFFAYLIGRTVIEVPTAVMKMPFSEFLKHMFSPGMFQWELILALVLGSILVTPFGAFTTRLLKTKRIHQFVGVLVVILGLATLIKTWI